MLYINPKCKMQRMFYFAGLLGTSPPLMPKNILHIQTTAVTLCSFNVNQIDTDELLNRY